MAKRTTLTLEDDVAERLDEEVRRRGVPFKTVVNDALRSGLSQRPEEPPFTVDARPMGVRPGIGLDDVQGLLDEIEGFQRR